MLDTLAKKENNLFQSQAWADFQKEVGKEPIFTKEYLGLKTTMLRGKDFLWLQRGPIDLKDFKAPEDLPKNTVFIRLEPFLATEKQIKKMNLKEVKRDTLLGGQKSPKATRALNIKSTEEEILAQMKPKTRYNIKLAGKKEVTVKITTDPKDVKILFKMLEKTSKRGKGYHHFEKGYYEKMMEFLAPQGILYLLLAESKGKPIAGILVSTFGEVATYLHGGFDSEYRNLMAPFLLQWEAIKLGKEKGCTVYDFWGIAETDDPKDSWAGITKFKEGFGGEKIIFPGAHDLVLDKFWYNILTLGANLRRLIKR